MSPIRSVVLRGFLCWACIATADALGDGPNVRLVPRRDVSVSARAAREADEELSRALRRRIDVEARKTPLSTWILELKRAASVHSIRLDLQSLKSEAIDPETPVTFRVKQATLGQVLTHVLPTLGLSWFPDHGDVVIGSTGSEEKHQILRQYDVRTLREAFRESEQLSFSDPRFARATTSSTTASDPLTDLILQTSSGSWRATSGTGGEVSETDRRLFVRQTYAGQAEVAGLLKVLSLYQSGSMKHSAAEVLPPWCPASSLAAIETALQRQIPKVELVEVPLRDAVESLARSCEISIQLDEAAFEADAVDADAPVTSRQQNVTLREALERILQPCALKATSRNGLLTVSTLTEVEDPSWNRTVAYDVHDLLVDDVTPASFQRYLSDNTPGPWMNVEGTGGDVAVILGGCCIVRHNESVQLEVAGLIDTMRACRRTIEAERAAGPNVAVAASVAQLRFYPQQRKERARQVAESLAKFVAIETWKGNGGEGTVHAVDGTVIVRQSPAVHAQVQAFLNRLSAAQRDASGE